MCAAIVSTALMFSVGARLFASAIWGAVGAAIFAASPILWRPAAVPPNALYPLPFLIAALLFSSYSREARRPLWAVAVGAVFGVGAYLSPSAAVMMPAYLALAVALLAVDNVVPKKHLAVAAGVFAVVAAPLAWSWLAQPVELRQAITAHHLYDAQRFNVLQGAHEMASWVGLTARSEVYWDYFNPAFLFLGSGVLLPLLIVLLPAGVLWTLSEGQVPIDWLLLAGALVAPLAASLSAEAPVPGRILFLTPFAALLSVRGLQYLLSFRPRSR